MEELILNEKLLNEFEKQSQDPVVELQFKSGVAYGTAFNFIKYREVPKREKTRSKIAKGIGAEMSKLFRPKISKAAS